MGYIHGEWRSQQTLFPLSLDDLISDDHLCCVIEAFVGRLPQVSPLRPGTQPNSDWIFFRRAVYCGFPG